MATQYGIQPSFSKGELSPRLHARVDYDGWRAGLAELYNFFTLRQGGARRRPGTYFAGMSKKQGASDVVRLVPFNFAPGQSYALEFGDHYLRFFALGGQVVTGGSTPYEIATPWAAADVRGLQFAQSYDVVYVTHRNYPPTKIIRKGETNWVIQSVNLEDGPYLEIDASGTAFWPNRTGNLTNLVTDTPSASSELSGCPASAAFDNDPVTEWRTDGTGALLPAILQYTFGAGPKVVTGYSLKASGQTVSYADVVGSTTTIYKIPGGLQAPRSWTFEGSNDGTHWAVLDTQAAQTGWGDAERRYYTFKNSKAYATYRLHITASNQADRPLAIAELALQGAGNDTITVTWSADSIASINGGAGFTNADIGRHLRILSEDSYWHWFRVFSVTSSSLIVTELMSPPLPSTKSSTSWRLGAFSPATGYPRSVGFFLGRLCYGGTTEKPQTVYGSQTEDYDSFGVSSPLKPDDAFSFTFGDSGEIQWLADNGDLLAGTASSIRSLGPADKTQGFSATNVAQGKPARTGAAAIQPLSAGTVPVFVGRFKDTIREVTFSSSGDGYAAPDISVLSEHLIRAGIVDIAFAQDPNALIWANTADGKLVGMTYEKDQQMVSMHGHEVGGDAFVESLCVLSGSERHELWMVVRRTRDDDTTMRTIERLAPDFEGRPQEEAYFVDCGVTYTGAPTTTVTGLEHLNGFEVSVMADGATEGEATVESGTLELPSGTASSTIHIGFGYDSRLTTLPIGQGMGDGSGLGRRKRVKGGIVDLLETGQIKIKASGRSWQEMISRPASSNMDAPPPLVTGSPDTGKTTVDDRWTGRGVASLLCDTPQPATVRAITLAFDGEP